MWGISPFFTGRYALPLVCRANNVLGTDEAFDTRRIEPRPPRLGSLLVLGPYEWDGAVVVKCIKVSDLPMQDGAPYTTPETVARAFMTMDSDVAVPTAAMMRRANAALVQAGWRPL